MIEKMVIYKADPHIKEVALIFDDGPNPLITPKLLEILKDKGVHANFFIIGARAEQSPDILKKIVRDGHEVGDHSYTHQHLSEVLKQSGEKAVKDEIEKSRAAIANISGLSNEEIRYFRPPFLDWNKELAGIAKSLYDDRIVMTPLKVSDWDWGNDDWDESQKSAILQKAAEVIHVWENNSDAGTIFAFHDSSQYNLPGNKVKNNWPHRAWPTLEAISEVADFILAKGFKIKKLSDMKLISEDQKIEM